MPGHMARAGLVALLALALAAPANANVPGGPGLVDFGQLECDGLGSISLFGPRGEKAPTGFTTSGLHLVATSIDVTFTDLEGNEFLFSKAYGTKAGWVTFTCSQSFEDPAEGSGMLTIVVAIVPRGS